MGSLGQTPGAGAGPVGVGVAGASQGLVGSPPLASRGILQPCHQWERHPGWMAEMKTMGNQGGKRRKAVGLRSSARAQRETWS